MRLRCEECGKEAATEEEARHWRAYLTAEEDEQPDDIAIYCPDCSKREFEDE